MDILDDFLIQSHFSRQVINNFRFWKANINISFITENKILRIYCEAFLRSHWRNKTKLKTLSPYSLFKVLEALSIVETVNSQFLIKKILRNSYRDILNIFTKLRGINQKIELLFSLDYKGYQIS